MFEKNITRGAEKPSEKEKFEFADLAEAEAYLNWKTTVPPAVRKMVEGKLLGRETGEIDTELPLTAEFLRCLDKSIRTGDAPHSSDERVANLLLPLADVDSVGGNKINTFKTLAAEDASWSLRARLYETQVKPALDWLVEQDIEKLKQDATLKKQAEESVKQSRGSEEIMSEDDDLPPQEDGAHSSMEMGGEKKEGAPKPHFTVAPFWGGYHRRRAFDFFDPTQSSSPGNLEKTSDQDHAAKNANVIQSQAEFDNLSARILSGKVRGGKPLILPMPYDWTPEISSLEIDAPAAAVKLEKTADNGWRLMIDSSGVFSYRLKIAPRMQRATEESFAAMEVKGDIAPELASELQKLKAQNLPVMKLARETIKLVRNHLTYSNSRAAWDKYMSDSRRFFASVWQNKEADCFVSNAMACRALRELGITCRFVEGYFVKDRNKAGDAIMHSCNGHAWLEVWDAYSDRSVRLDATPKGDPNMDEKTQEKDLQDDRGEGDYGEQDEIMPEEQVKKQIEDMKRAQAAGQNDAGRRAGNFEKEAFVHGAGCTAEQAAEFLRALDRVRKITDKEGRSVSDRLKDEWRKVVVARKVESSEYRGPVRMDKGDRLEDPVSAFIDVRAGEYNPTGFEKDERVEKEEFDFGGINLYFSFDLSGSMGWVDAASGRAKSDVQRDVALLFMDSIMQAAYISRQAGGGAAEDVLPIKIMVTVASSRGKVILSLTDRWGPKEQWAVYCALNGLAGGGTPTHETLQDIGAAIENENKSLQKKRTSVEKMPVHYVAELTDGAPDRADLTEAEHLKIKKQGAAIRSYCIGGVSASADAAPPIASFSEVSDILAEDVIKQFKKLNPRRVKV